jgi:acetyltransferase-like isoleucine patch superfamily enzyme
MIGFPDFTTGLPGVDKLGADCRISPSVTIMRHAPSPGRREIRLGNGVILLDHVRLLLGDNDIPDSTHLEIGDRVIINVGSYVSGEGGLLIEDDVMVGPHSRILSAGHQVHGGDAIIARNAITYAPIVIGRGAWLGAGTTVLQGVNVGAGAVVGAGSVVTRDIPPFAVAVGNPAKVKSFRRGHVGGGFWRHWLQKWRP